MIPVILSGGSGSRLWPLSRSMRPKQFLGVTDSRSLFQLTLKRLEGTNGTSPVHPIIVANADHRFLVGEQCREMGVTPADILLEPVARNTAPAIAAAALPRWLMLAKAKIPFCWYCLRTMFLQTYLLSIVQWPWDYRPLKLAVW